MYIRKALLLTNACLICLVLWLASDVFMKWRTQRHGPVVSNKHLSSDPSPASANQARKKDLSQYAAIQRIDVFKTKRQSQQVSEPPPQATPLSIELIGTSVGDGTMSRAIVLDKTAGREEIIHLNSKIQGAQVIEILHDRAVFLVNGRKETRLIASLEKSLSKPAQLEKKVVEAPEKKTIPEIKRPSPRAKPAPPTGGR